MKTVFDRSIRLCGLAVMAMLPAFAATAGPQTTVVELFTSQSCYSCPPAEKFLGKLVEERDIVALEYHVDYWDSLVYGSAGKWKDRFSDTAHTERQRAYNAAIRRTNGVYTPQIVIDGRLETTGTETRAIRAAIRKSRSRSGPRLSIMVEKGDGGLTIRVGGDARGNARIRLVTFIRLATTEIRRGENMGKTLTNHHVVTRQRRIGTWQGKPMSIGLREGLPGADEGCAVLAQKGEAGPILGVAYCPTPGA